MSHLGERVSDLVDQQLSAEATERALAHLAACPACREQAELERLTKQRLAALPEVTPSTGLMSALLQMGGPDGPLPPRVEPLPGTRRPQTVAVDGWSSASRRPAGARSDGRGTGRATRPGGRDDRRVARRGRRFTAAVLGALSVVGVGVALSVAPRSDRLVPPVDTFVIQHTVTTGTLPFSEQIGWRTGGEDGR